MKNIRIEKLESVLLREISSIILTRMQDPRIKYATITKVKISKDLKFVKVFFSYLGEENDVKTIKKIFQKSSGFIRNQLRGRLRMRNIPNLSFSFDSSIEKSMHIVKLIDKVAGDINNNEETTYADE